MYKIIKLKDKNIINDLALFFNKKWKIDINTYIDSMNDSLNNIIPSWYYVLSNNEIIAGVGVIKNDFHKRLDLTPNICALYVKEEYRGNNISRNLLDYVINDLKNNGISDVYLITTHKTFYEKCGFIFYDNIEENDGNIIRCYHKKII